MTEEKQQGRIGVDPVDIDTLVDRISLLFSDANLRRDSFLRHWLIREDGSVPIPILLQHKLFKDEGISEDNIRQAAGSPALSYSIDLTADRASIRRVNAFTMDLMDAHIPRTLILQNVPTKDTIVDSGNEICLRAFIRGEFMQYGNVVMVDYQFKQATKTGTVVVEFATQDELQRASRNTATIDKDGASIVPKKSVQIEGNEVSVIPLQDDMHRSENFLWRLYQSTVFQPKTAPKAREIPAIPVWKSIPFRPEQPVYLYRLLVTETYNRPNTGVGRGAPLGIAVSTDLYSLSSLSHTCGKKDHSFETSFAIPKQPNQSWTARLYDMTAYNDGFSVHQLGKLRQFHRVLLDWKTYGLGNARVPHGIDKSRYPPQTYDDKLSSYLFVPIKRINGSNTVEIEWDAIDREIYQNPLPLLLNSCSNSVSVTDQNFQDCVLRHRNLAYRGLRFRTDMNAASPFPSQQEPIDEATLAMHMERYNLDLETATFADYFEKKYNMKVRDATRPLLEARPITSMANELINNDERVDQSDDPAAVAYLIPEFVSVQPVSVPSIFTISLAVYFMPALERAIDVCIFTHRLLADVKESMNNSLDLSGMNFITDKRVLHKIPLVPLLDEATGINPNTYERLEFLGDSVLEYFLGLNALASNECFKLDCDELDEAWMLRARKNKTIRQAAMHCKLDNIIKRSHLYKFRSAYAAVPPKRAKEVDIGARQWSDCVESVLGAAFLGDASWTLAVYFLELLNLPRFGPPAESPKETISETKSWLVAPGLSIHRGYPINDDANLSQQIAKVSTILTEHPRVKYRLIQGQRMLLKSLGCSTRGMSAEKRPLLEAMKSSSFSEFMFGSLGAVARMLSSTTSTDSDVLLQCALFDDELLNDSEFAPDTFLPVVLLRDSIYVYGHRALQLAVTDDLFRRYPRATPRDMNMLRSCALNDDVLSYVLVKHGIHKTLYDQKSKSAELFQAYINKAEKVAYDRNASGGFVLETFPGLGRGRLLGLKEKVDPLVTEELMVSFKTIVGAIALDKGVVAMWLMMGPLFLEMLQISPERMRDLYLGESTLVG